MIVMQLSLLMSSHWSWIQFCQSFLSYISPIKLVIKHTICTQIHLKCISKNMQQNVQFFRITVSLTPKCHSQTFSVFCTHTQYFALTHSVYFAGCVAVKLHVLVHLWKETIQNNHLHFSLVLFHSLSISILYWSVGGGVYCLYSYEMLNFRVHDYTVFFINQLHAISGQSPGFSVFLPDWCDLW